MGICGHNVSRKFFIQHHDRSVGEVRRAGEEDAEIRQESKAESKVQMQEAKGERQRDPNDTPGAGMEIKHGVRKLSTKKLRINRELSAVTAQARSFMTWFLFADHTHGTSAWADGSKPRVRAVNKPAAPTYECHSWLSFISWGVWGEPWDTPKVFHSPDILYVGQESLYSAEERPSKAVFVRYLLTVQTDNFW